MLILAFQQRLTFTIGKSLTTGIDNAIVWAGIGHKTSTTGGAYGFPDPKFYETIQQEFALRKINLKRVENFEIDFTEAKEIKIKNGKHII